VSLVNIYAAQLIVMDGRQRNATNSQIWGNLKRLDLWRKMYVTWLPVRDLENFRLLDFCWTEGTYNNDWALKGWTEDDYGALVEWFWQCRTEVRTFGDKTLPVSISPPPFFRDLTREKYCAPAVRSHWLTAWVATGSRYDNTSCNNNNNNNNNNEEANDPHSWCELCWQSVICALPGSKLRLLQDTARGLVAILADTRLYSTSSVVVILLNNQYLCNTNMHYGCCGGA
jgi:hypothetical protein